MVLQALLLASLLLPAASGPSPEDLEPGVAARGPDFEITENSYDDYLARSYVGKDLGKALLDQMIQEEAISQEAGRRGVGASKGELEARIAQLDDRIRLESGGQKGLTDTLKENQVEQDDFFAALRLSIDHEKMAREDFGLGRNEEVPVEKLNVWLKDLLGKTRIATEGLDDGVLAEVNGKKIRRVDFGRRLKGMLEPATASSVLTEMIGIEVIRAKARALGVVLEESDVAREIGERENLLQSKPGLASVTYENFVQAVQGQSLKELAATDKFRAEVLLKKICQGLHHDAYLKDFYEKNRAYFNARFGRAARLSTIFLKAVMFPNQFITRKYEEAEAELKALKDRIERGEVTFEEMVRIYSDHESKDKGGDLGFVPPGTPGWEEAASAALDAPDGSLIGPFRTKDGCHLLKVTAHREDPSFEEIRDEVAREARQRYYRSLLEEADVQRKF